jgi:hypothetical protein
MDSVTHDIRSSRELPVLDEASLRRVYDRTVSAALLYVSVGVGIMYLVLLAGHWLTLPDHYRNQLVIAAAAGVAILWTTALIGWRRGFSPGIAHAVGAIIIGVLLVNCAMHFALSGEMKQSSNLALLVVAIGCFLLSLRWWSALVGTTIGLWAWIAFRYIDRPDWAHYGFMLFIATVLSMIVVSFRRRNVCLQEQLRRADAARLKELETALHNIQTLEGLIPICAWCKKVRDDDGFWNEVESYISGRTEATFTHGMCPSCAEKNDAELERQKRADI